MIPPGVESFPRSARTPGQEQIVPDGVATAHARIIVITTAGRALAFK